MSKANASKAAVELARANELDIGTITGTGSGGQVTQKDVKAAIAAKTGSPAGGSEAGQSPAAADPDPTPPKSKSKSEPIVRVREDLNGFWACPFDDNTQPLDHTACGLCGAERQGEGKAVAGEEVRAP